jgi:hypothetical protein
VCTDVTTSWAKRHMSHVAALVGLSDDKGGGRRLWMLRHQLDVRPQGPAEALMKMPTEDGITTAGPTFEYVPPAEHAGLQDQRAGIHSDDRLERV